MDQLEGRLIVSICRMHREQTRPEKTSTGNLPLKQVASFWYQDDTSAPGVSTLEGGGCGNMLKIITRRHSEGHSIPVHLTTLSVSWLNNQFKAVAIHRGVVAGTWERPGETDGPGNFGAFIREAVQQTGYRGTTVSLLLSHPRLAQQLLDVPPARGAPLQRIIQRQAQQQKMFPGEAAWANQLLPSAKGTQRVLLHLFPRTLLDQFVQGCKQNGLHLTAVLPASVVLQNQLTQLSAGNEELEMLAAETGGSTTAIVGRGDGQMLLARTLPGNWNDDPARLALDLHRTVLFVNQQFGTPASHRVWLFGPGAAERCDTVQDHMQLTVEVSPVAYEPFYWATEAVKVPPELCANLLSPELQKAPQRRAFAKVVATATVLLMAGALTTAVYAHLQARRDRETIKNASTQIAELESKQITLRQLDEELKRKQELVEFVEGGRPTLAPAWLLAYLGEVLPSDLVVTNLQVTRSTNQWRLRISGTAQRAVKTPEAVSLADSVRVLKAKLSGAPFHLTVIEESAKEKPQPVDDSMTGWLNRATSGLSGKEQRSRTEPQKGFVIEGIMK